MHRVYAKTFTIAELRALLGVPAGKLDRFADLHRRAVQSAINEINQLSRLNLVATPHKTGRVITSVESSGTVKGDADKAKAARELKGHSAGRKARRGGTVESVALPPLPAFPLAGGFAYSPQWQKRFEIIWADFGRAHNARPDSARVADRVRRIIKDQNLSPDSPRIDTILANVLKNWKQA